MSKELNILQVSTVSEPDSSQPDSSQPIACSLTPAEIDHNRDSLLPGLAEKANARERLPSGFRFRFTSSAALLTEIGGVLGAEHACCRFLRFELTVEPAGGPVTLDVTGPRGTVEFLESLL